MAPTLDSRISLEALYAAIWFTLIRLELDPRLQQFAPVFQQVVAKWWDVYKKERDLLDNKITGDARVDFAHADLKTTSDGVAGTILIETKNNRKAPQFVRYYGTHTPSAFRKSGLDAMLTTMRTWPPSLKESANPTLKAHGEILLMQVTVADKAVQMLSLAEQEVTDFSTFGERQQFFNEVNGLRKELHGDVAKLVHAHPEWNLTRAYVDSLFEHETAQPEPSDTDISRKIESLRAAIAKLESLREQRTRDAEDEALERAQAEKEAKLAIIEAAEKEVAEASAKLATIKAQIGPIT